MASENDTVASISDYIRHMADNLEPGVILTIPQCNFIADSIETAHSREVDDLTFKLMTAKSEQKTAANVIIEQTNKVEKLEREVAVMTGERKGILKANESLAADNTRLRGEVAELRECLKEAIDDRCTWCKNWYGNCLTIDGKDCETIVKWRKVLEGAKDDNA